MEKELNTGGGEAAGTLLDEPKQAGGTNGAEGGSQGGESSAGGAGDGGSPTLLDDDPGTDGGGESQPPAPETQDPGSVEKYLEGIPALDLGDGVRWDDAALKAVAPELMSLTGGDPKKADGLVKAYAKHVQAQRKAASEQAEAFSKGLVEECRKRFGADLKLVARDARRGGRAIFGDGLWDALKGVPAFANNPDVLERLAAHGRTLDEDKGAAKPYGGAGGDVEGDVLHRMYGEIKVGG